MSMVMDLNWKSKRLLAEITAHTFEHSQSIDLLCYHKFPKWKMYEYAQSVNSFPGNTSVSDGFRASDTATAVEFPPRTPEHEVKSGQVAACSSIKNIQ